VSFRLAEVAAWLGGELQGPGDLEIDGLAPLEDAGPRELAFLASPRYRDKAAASRAGVLLVAQPLPDFAGAQVVVADPYLAFAELLARFHPERRREPGIHPSAVLAAGAVVDPSAHIGPYAVVGAGSRVGARAVVSPFVVVGAECEVGEDSVLHPHVVLYDRTRVGRRVVLHAGVVLGSDGFGYAASEHGPVKIPQVGRVEVGDDVEIGANSTIDRATLGATTIGAQTKIDNLVQVGHNVRIGRAAILCGQSGIAGSTRLGDGVILAGQAGVSGHLEIGDGAKVAAKSAALWDIAAGQQVAGIPAVDAGQWRRQQALLRRLAELDRRLRRLERISSTDPDGGRADHD